MMAVRSFTTMEDEDEPSIHDALKDFEDAILSNRLVRNLKRKFQAQSYYEFFNRTLGSGGLLFILGVIGILATFAFTELNIGLLVATDGRLLIAAAVVLWLILGAVSTINDGSSPFSVNDEPGIWFEFLRAIFGLLLIGVISYEIYWTNSDLIEGLVFTFAGAALVGMWLIGISWMFGGIIGVYRNLKR